MPYTISMNCFSTIVHSSFNIGIIGGPWIVTPFSFVVYASICNNGKHGNRFIHCIVCAHRCVQQDDHAETAFKTASPDERHALLRMLGAMSEYTAAEYNLIAQLPIVEVWETKASKSAASKHRVGTPTDGDGEKSFISVKAAVERKQIFHTDGTANVWMKRGRQRRALVLQRDGPNDQYNAGVVALLQACAQTICESNKLQARMTSRANTKGDEYYPHLSEMECFTDDLPTRTLNLAQRCVILTTQSCLPACLLIGQRDVRKRSSTLVFLGSMLHCNRA